MAGPRLSLLDQLFHLAAGPATDAAPDQQLLDRFVTGQEEDAFTALVRRHGPMVLGVCYRLLRDTHDAEDAFQATFLVLARKAASIHKRDSVGSWLHGVALRVAGKARVETVRRSRRERLHPAPAIAVTGDAITWGELRSVLDEELGRLPSSWRAPLILCYLEGQTQDEAARRLGWSKSTLRRRLERGRGLLRSRLAQRGVTLSAGLCAPLLSESAASAALPIALTATTVKTALLFRESQWIGAEILSRPLTLANAVLKSMLLAKCKMAALAVFTLCLLTGAGLTAYQIVFKNAAEAQQVVTPAAVANRGESRPEPAFRAPVDLLGDPLPADALARLGTIRLQHGASPRALSFAPNGRSLASAGIDGTVHIWECLTGKELLRIDNERFPDLGLGSVNGLAYSPDGKTLAGARINQPACLWDVATGKELRQFGGDRHRASWVVFSPDGKALAYGGGMEDSIIRLADVNTGNDLHRFGGHKGFVSRVAFSPDGTVLASADDQAIHLFDIAADRGHELQRPEGQAVRFDLIAFSADGKVLAAASPGQSLIWLVEAATGKSLRTITLTGRERVDTMLFAPDGRSLISGHQDGFVRFWDPSTGAKMRQFRVHSLMVIAMALSADGRTLATSCNSHIAGAHGVRLWETSTGKRLVQYAGPQEGIARLVFSPDSRRVATASWDGAIYLWEAATGKLLYRWERFGPLAFTPDSKTLVCGGWSDGKVRSLDLTTWKEAGQFSAHAKGIRDLCLARDGQILATAGSDQYLRLWDLATGRQLRDFGGKQKHYVFRLAQSPDAKLLASIHEDHVVRLWETTTGKLLREQAEPDHVGSAAFSPDGRLLALTSMGVLGGNPLIRLLEVPGGKEISQLRGNADALDAVAFSPDGRTLIWGGQHRKDLYLWELASGQLRRKFSGHQGHLTCVAFSPDGRIMASGSSDASVLIWDATGQRRRQQPRPSPLRDAQLDKLWADLAANDAAIAYQAICTLSASPLQAVPLLEQHLKPVPRVDEKKLAEAMRDLDSEQFTVRNRATQDLERWGEAVELSLREVLAHKPSLEVRRRVEQMLARIGGPDQLRWSRALEVLENIDSPASRRMLTALARGEPQAGLTNQAEAAMNRLTR